MSENKSGKFHNVFGYIEESERIALQKCVLETSEVLGHAMEIGSLNGLSALLILSVLKSDKELICLEKNSVEALTFNLDKFGFRGNRIIINKDFKEEIILDPWLSFVFIDHSHTHQDNIDAFEKFWPRVSAGGILSFHDYNDPNWEDGTRAINELIVKYSLTTYIMGGSFISFRKNKP